MKAEKKKKKLPTEKKKAVAIRVSPETYDFLKTQVQDPLRDTPDKILQRLLKINRAS